MDDDTDRKADIEWLMTDALGSISTVKSSKLTFSYDLSKYFDDKYHSFLRAAKTLTDVNIDDFISSTKVHSAVFNLTEAFNEKYGFYVYIDDELLTLDEFVRSVKPGESYYIGSTIDYHY